MQQSPLTLAFRSGLMESEFGRWVAQHHFKVGCACCAPAAPASMQARPHCPWAICMQDHASLPACMRPPSPFVPSTPLRLTSSSPS